MVEVEKGVGRGGGGGGGGVGKDSSVVSRTVTAHFDWRVHGCCTICQTDRSEIRGNRRRKWNDIFRLNRANQYIGMTLTTFGPFPNSLTECI